MANGFPKQNKLCGQLRIAQLYKDGQRFVAWPLRVTYKVISHELSAVSTQVLVWAPKSLFKQAVQRNHLRRLMREAYRLNQDLLGNGHYQIAFNYMDKEEQPFAVIEKAVCKALKKIAEK
jgi:ribonuclease P protein component